MPGGGLATCAALVLGFALGALVGSPLVRVWRRAEDDSALVVLGVGDEALPPAKVVNESPINIPGNHIALTNTGCNTTEANPWFAAASLIESRFSLAESPSCRILSNDYRRYNHSNHVLIKAGIGPCQKFKPLNSSSPLVQQRLKQIEARHGERTDYSAAGVLSNLLSFSAMWWEFAMEPGDLKDWRLFFEDDLTLSVNVSSREVRASVDKVLTFASKDGIALLGVCEPTLRSDPVLAGRIQYAKVSGRCAHAFALTRWRAVGLWAQMEGGGLAVTKVRSDGSVTVDNQMLHDSEYFMDVRLDLLGRESPIWAAGTNLVCFDDPNKGVAWTGLFCQDRDQFPSTLGQDG